MNLQDVLKLLGGVALLIYGIKTMGDSLQELAGDNLRRLLASITGTPVKGVAVGALVTMIIQSSSATTVMVVSFVHVGLLSLAQGFSVVMGANIGTTITAQLIAFDIQKYSIVAAIIGALLFVMGKSSRQKQFGFGLVGFALLFVGMGMMRDAMDFLSDRQDIFLLVNNNPLAGLMVGMLVTMLIQASAATVGITMAIASQGLLSLPAAIAIILGDNIGTTITAVLASLGGNRAAKQAAVAHVMFNVIGATIMMLFLTPFTKLVLLTSSDIARQVANSHTLFNVVNTCVFLPFIKPYTLFIKRIIPYDVEHTFAEQGARYLDNNLIEVSPAAGVEAVRKEMVRMGGIAINMLKDCYSIILDGNTKLIPDVLMTEKTLNQLNHQIIQYSTELGQKILSSDLSMMLNLFSGGVSDIERMGDHGENLVELAQFMLDRKQDFSEKAIKECREMFDLVLDAAEKSINSIEKENFALSQQVIETEKKIDQMEKILRARHIERLNSGKCQPSAGVVFVDVLSNLERIGDHANNLAFIVKDMKTISYKQVKGK